MNNNQDYNNSGQQILNNMLGSSPTSPQSNNGSNTFFNQNVQGGATPNNNPLFNLGATQNVTYADTIGNINANNNQSDEALKEKAIGSDNSNQFINTPNNYNETSLSDLNVDGTYNKLEKPDYTNDPKVIENIESRKKNTIPVTKEMKTFIIIILVMLVFIFIMPSIFDFIRNIKYR